MGIYFLNFVTETEISIFKVADALFAVLFLKEFDLSHCNFPELCCYSSWITPTGVALLFFSQPSHPRLAEPPNQLSSPAGTMINLTQKPTDLQRAFLICAQCWPHRSTTRSETQLRQRTLRKASGCAWGQWMTGCRGLWSFLLQQQNFVLRLRLSTITRLSSTNRNRPRCCLCKQLMFTSTRWGTTFN